MLQKGYKTRFDWVGKVIHWKLCKKLKFDQITERYMHKPESVPQNGTHKVLGDLEILIDHPIPVRRLDLVMIEKKDNLLYGRFCCPVEPESGYLKKRKERQVLEPC